MTLTPRALTVLLPLALTLAVGCKKSGSTEAAAESSSGGGGGSSITAQMPEGKDAMAFAEKLVETTVSDWNPVDGGGEASFTYNQMTFSGSGSWSAKAVLEASFEEIPCVENGTWAIESVESNANATLTWTVDKTTCPTRQAGTEQRVQMTLTKANQYKISFR